MNCAKVKTNVGVFPSLRSACRWHMKYFLIIEFVYYYRGDLWVKVV